MLKSLKSAAEYVLGVVGLALTMYLCWVFTLAFFGGAR